MELLLIRHGLPVRSDDTSDPPLSAAGHWQAARVAERLADEGIDAVFASTMRRVIETARPFARAAGHEVQVRDGIVEFDREGGTYIPMEELKRDDYPRWKAMVDGGYGVDIASFQKLVVATLEDIVEANPSKTVAVFCHGGVINVWTAHVLGMAPRLFFEPTYASVHRYLCARTGQRNIVALNDDAHLRGVVQPA
ncbi:MAG TPA: histidine phosphatase family protein [Caulobacteraceae bacterium]|nr:histidine phosphatase family protein [Caulobacteraceae bacterium]